MPVVAAVNSLVGCVILHKTKGSLSFLQPVSTVASECLWTSFNGKPESDPKHKMAFGGRGLNAPASILVGCWKSVHSRKAKPTSKAACFFIVKRFPQRFACPDLSFFFGTFSFFCNTNHSSGTWLSFSAISDDVGCFA